MKKRKKTPEEIAYERESAERLAKLREHVARGWADLEEKRRRGFHLQNPAWGPPPDRA